jgi:hypothetical protein
MNIADQIFFSYEFDLMCPRVTWIKVSKLDGRSLERHPLIYVLYNLIVELHVRRRRCQVNLKDVFWRLQIAKYLAF